MKCLRFSPIVTLASSTILFFLSILSPQTTAVVEIIETYDSPSYVQAIHLFGDNATVYVSATDGFTSGGNATAIIVDESSGEQISINLYDNGSGPGDIPDDKNYTGEFTVKWDEGVNGKHTDDALDIIDLSDGGSATIIADIDLGGDPGFVMIEGDFIAPQVTINSGPDTVDSSYALNTTIMDRNIDNNRVWYSVDGGGKQPLTWKGGSSYESIVDTSVLLDGPHTIRVIAYDLVGNVQDSQTVTITVYHPKPEISISVEFDPPQPREGDSVTITAIIENTGDADAQDVTVNFYVDDGSIGEWSGTITAGGSRTLQTSWEGKEGSHSVRVEIEDPAGTQLASAQIPAFEVQPKVDGAGILGNPWILAIIIVVITIALIGGTVLFAYLGREMVQATKARSIPAEQPSVLPQESDPCEEIRRKWKAILAEYERAKAEMEGAGERARLLREEAGRARKTADETKEEAKEANEALMEAKKELEETKKGMHDFFAEGISAEGISVGTPETDGANHIGFFRGIVRVYFKDRAHADVVSKYVEEHSEDYDKLQEAYDEIEEGMPELKMESAKANRSAVEAEARAIEAEREAREAEREYRNLESEVHSLREKAETFRQKFRMCQLKRLRKATNRANWGAQELGEAARSAQNAKDQSEFEKYKEKAEEAKEKVEEAREQAESIKEKLEEEGVEEELEELDDRMERAMNDAASALAGLAATEELFYPREDNIGKPCRGDASKVLGEHIVQYQFFDPTHRIRFPHFFEHQSGGESGKVFIEYLTEVREICRGTLDVIEEGPGGNLMGLSSEQWSKIDEAGSEALKKIGGKGEEVGFVRMSGLAIPTNLMRTTCQDRILCKEGKWQKQGRKMSVTAPTSAWISYPHDDPLPVREAIEWVQSRLQGLRRQQCSYKKGPCA